MEHRKLWLSFPRCLLVLCTQMCWFDPVLNFSNVHSQLVPSSLFIDLSLVPYKNIPEINSHIIIKKIATEFLLHYKATFQATIHFWCILRPRTPRKRKAKGQWITQGWSSILGEPFPGLGSFLQLDRTSIQLRFLLPFLLSRECRQLGGPCKEECPILQTMPDPTFVWLTFSEKF